MTCREPRLVTVIKRLAELEALAEDDADLSELNRLRIELGDRWPEVSAALAHAYVSEGMTP